MSAAVSSFPIHTLSEDMKPDHQVYSNDKNPVSSTDLSLSSGPPNSDVSASSPAGTTILSASPTSTTKHSDAEAGLITELQKEVTQFQSAPQSHALIDGALEFLGTASNGVLGTCLVGLGATTYLVFGRVGLVLIGVVGGVVLHASWDGSLGKFRKGKFGKEDLVASKDPLDILAKALEVRNTNANSVTGTDDTSPATTEERNLNSFRPETSAALAEFADALVATQVSPWYSYLIPGEFLFPEACYQTVVRIIIAMGDRLSRKRPADVLLDFMTNTSSIVIVYLNELLAAVNASPGVPVPKAVDVYLKANPDSSLARLVDRKSQQQKLDAVADDIMNCFLDKRTVACEPTSIFLKQVLAKVILDGMIQKCADEEFINSWIVYLLEDKELEPESSSDPNAEDSLLNPHQHEILHPHRSDNQEQVVFKAHEAMDEAMREARRVTDEFLAREKAEKGAEKDDSSNVVAPADRPPSAQPPSKASSRHSVEKASTSPVADCQAMPRSSAETAQGEYSNFDQILPKSSIVDGDVTRPAPLLLHNATVILYDEAPQPPSTRIKSLPKWDFILQIEPQNNYYSGWIVMRKYVDFVNLHEVLRKISVIAGVTQFTVTHSELPSWKGQTIGGLRAELEAYLSDAVRMAPLADSEGMRRFLEKDQAQHSGNHSPLTGATGNGTKFAGLSWPNPSAFETMGKGMIDALSKAPKEIAGGSKSLIGNVAGVFGAKKGPTGENMNANKAATFSSPRSSMGVAAPSQSFPASSIDKLPSPLHSARQSLELSSSSSLNRKAGRPDSSCGTPTHLSQSITSDSIEQENQIGFKAPVSAVSTPKGHRSLSPPRSSSEGARIPLPESWCDEMKIKLPPPPSMVPDDYDGETRILGEILEQRDKEVQPPPQLSENAQPSAAPKTAASPKGPTTRAPAPLTEDETVLSIDLLFALLSSLYTLSPSFWTLRRSLLSAAKTFLLRPGTDQLDSIRDLLQSTVLDYYTSDEGIADLVRNLRRSSFPLPGDEQYVANAAAAATNSHRQKGARPLPSSRCESESGLGSNPETTSEIPSSSFLSAESVPTPSPSPAPSNAASSSKPAFPTSAERAQFRARARHLAETRAVPAMLASVMGAAATREAVGRVWESLMVKEVARGVIFGILLQGLRTLTQ